MTYHVDKARVSADLKQELLFMVIQAVFCKAALCTKLADLENCFANPL